MPRYHLVAARDGDLIDIHAEWPNESVAEVWASGLIALEFQLDPEIFSTFEEVAAETDACHLDEVEEDPIALATIDLLQTLHTVMSKRCATSFMSQDRPSVAAWAHMAALALALKDAGYSGNRPMVTS